MAESVHLYLTANGEDINGENGSIECLSFSDSVHTDRGAGSAMATGRRTYEPIVIRKRIDASSPLIARALTNNEAVEAVFRFFRPSPLGDGTTEQFFTVEIGEGRLTSIRRVSPDTIDPASASRPPTEEISIAFHRITWTYEPDGTSHHDDWSENQ